MNLDLLTNATVVDDAIRFVSGMSKDKEKIKSSSVSNEYYKEDSKANEYDEYKELAHRIF